MTFRTSIKKNSKRLFSLDALLIILCDLGTVAIFYLLGIFTVKTIIRLSSVLSKVILDKQMMLSNPSVVSFNLALFRQAGIYTTTWVVLSLLFFALLYALLNYVQWSRVAKKALTLKNAAYFCITEALWFIIILLVSFFLLWSVLDPEKYSTALFLLFILFAHMTLGLHRGLLLRKTTFSFRGIVTYVSEVFSPGFSHWKDWVLAYGLLAVVLGIALLIGGFFVTLQTVGFIVLGILFLLALCFWRMMMWDLLPHH